MTMRRWSGVIAVEGEASSDGRLIALGATEWGHLPLTLRALGVAGPAGTIDTIERQGDGVIWASGEVGADGERKLAERTLAAVAIDAGPGTATDLDADTLTFTKLVIGAGTLVDAVPWPGAVVTLDPEPTGATSVDPLNATAHGLVDEAQRGNGDGIAGAAGSDGP